MKNAFMLIGIGLAIGAINGFLGAGGGMLLVPALTDFVKDMPKKAHATAVFIILPVSIASGLAYLFKGVIDWSVLLPVAIGTVVGGLAGTFLMKKLASDVVSIIFWVVMIGSGLAMIFFA